MDSRTIAPEKAEETEFDALPPRPYLPFSEIASENVQSNRPHIFESVFAIIALLHSAGAFYTITQVFWWDLDFRTGLWVVAYGIALASLFIHFGPRWIFWLAQYFPLAITVIVFACISQAWSMHPSNTVARSIHLVGTTLLGIYLGYRFPIKSLFNILLVTFAILIVAGDIFAVIAPTNGRVWYFGVQVWKGLHGDKNAFGFTAILAVLFVCVRLFSSETPYRTLHFVLIPFILLAIHKSDSATSLGACLIALFVMATFATGTVLRLHGAAAFCLLGTGVVLLIGALTFISPELLTSIVGRSADFTGRQEVWEGAWEMTQQSPLLGHGYGALWSSTNDTERTLMMLLGMDWAPSHAHNGFLQLSSEMGIPIAIVGSLFLLQMLVHPIVSYFRQPSPVFLLGIGVQIAMLASSLFEARLFLDRNPIWVLYIVFSVATMRAAQRFDELARTNGPAYQVA
ncbi:MAG: O-antigen ligase family protein [Rhodospirillales bacterium]|nr:O-antigen ligase family protein [Rhodospirillales bacterium]